MSSIGGILILNGT